MEQNFTSSGYTIGVEEELMIVDGETFELSNAIEQLLEEGDAGDQARAHGVGLRDRDAAVQNIAEAARAAGPAAGGR